MNKQVRAALRAHCISKETARFRLPRNSRDIEIIYADSKGKERSLLVCFSSVSEAEKAMQETVPGSLDMDTPPQKSVSGSKYLPREFIADL